MRLRALLIIVFLTLGCNPVWAASSIIECDVVLAGFQDNSSQSTDVYLSLIRALVKNKNAMTAEDLDLLISKQEVFNPFEIVNLSLSLEQAYAFKVAFINILKNKETLNWEVIENELRQLRDEKEVSETKRAAAKEETQNIFAPLVLDKVGFEGGKGKIKSTFQLPDGSMLAALWERSTIGLYDVQQKKRIQLGNNLSEFGTSAVSFLTLTSGNSLIVRRNDKNEITAYEIDGRHELRLILDDVKLDLPSQRNGNISGVGPFLLQRPDGHKIVVELITKWDQLSQSHPILGHLELDIDTRQQEIYFIGGPDTQAPSVRMNSDGNIEYRSLNQQGQREISVFELKQSKVILPEEFRSDLTQHFNFSELKVGFSGGRVSKTSKWVSAESGKTLGPIEEWIQSIGPIVVIPHKGEYRVGAGWAPGRSLAIFDPVKEQMEVEPLPKEIGHPRSLILKLKNLKTFLFIGSNSADFESKSLVWTSLDDGTSGSVDMSREKVGRLVRVYETKDGRIEALFEAKVGFKVIQIYGPVAKGDS